jgi:antirestriction protein ArdC
MAKLDVYESVTNKIIAELEAFEVTGYVPWTRPWQTSGKTGPSLRLGSMRPVNAITKRPYNGINVLLLWLEGVDKGFTSNKWLTFKQAKEAGGSVNKGERGTKIVLFKPYTKTVINGAGEQEDINRLFATEWTVFNVEQTTLVDKFADTVEAPKPVVVVEGNQRREDIDAFFAATGANITHGGDRAYYISGTNDIRLPHLEQFKSSDDYYATSFHEGIHWTWCDGRITRTFAKRHNQDTYPLEELVAELGAAFLCADFGVTGKLQHASYIGSWLRALKNDKKFIFTAASNANKACEYLHKFSSAEDSHIEELELAA